MFCLHGWGRFLCFSKPKRETRKQRAKRLQKLKDSYLARDRAYIAAQQNSQLFSDVKLHETRNKPKSSSRSSKGGSQTPKSKYKRQSKTKHISKSKHKPKPRKTTKDHHRPSGITKDSHRPSTARPSRNKLRKSKSTKGKEPVRDKANAA